MSNAFKQVTKALAPAVVHITSTDKIEPVTSGRRGGQLTPEMPEGLSPFEDEFFRRFFDQSPGMTPQPRERVGQGTGVIVKPDGYIVTNNHVVAQADNIKVKLSDDREYEATVVGTDVETDLAVIKIEAEGLTAARFGDSAKLEQGEWVVAIGNPFGLDHTVTAGIVSAKGRNNMGLATFEDFIQTDAAINPGNSGGPLVNLYGEVVGINSAISSRTGGNMGIGFAIPSNMVKSVFESIIETGSVERGWLGVSIQALTEDLAKSFNFEGTQGVLLADVIEDTPAARSGLKAGDIVVKVDSRRTNAPTELLDMVAKTKPGEKVTLEVYRDGKVQTIDVTLGERPAQVAARGGESSPSEPVEDLGLRVQTLTPELAQRLGVRDVRGVVITAVESGSPAAQVGLQQGDVIGRVGETPVRSAEDFSRAMSSADLENGVRLQIHTPNGTRFVVLKSNE
jgi:serine protease Do